jgi:hypothetical protein
MPVMRSWNHEVINAGHSKIMLRIMLRMKNGSLIVEILALYLN